MARAKAYREGRRRAVAPAIDRFLISTKAGEEIPSTSGSSRSRTFRSVSRGTFSRRTTTRIMRQLMKEITDREYAARDLALSEK
jgi:hypothetical protein